jgi:uncharacterized protein with HEPN domain
VKDDRLYLGHILEAVDRLLTYGQEGEEVFRRDMKTQDAVIRNLHDYFGISLDIVWDEIQNHVPPLRDKLGRLMNRNR